MPGMTKRVLAAILWFYAGWYAGAMLAEFIGVSPLLGPLIGAAAAGLIAGDPRRIIWKSHAHGVDDRHAGGPARGSLTGAGPPTAVRAGPLNMEERRVPVVTRRSSVPRDIRDGPRRPT